MENEKGVIFVPIIFITTIEPIKNEGYLIPL